MEIGLKKLPYVLKIVVRISRNVRNFSSTILHARTALLYAIGKINQRKTYDRINTVK